jgi:3-oxoadipate enol-lactonase
MEDGCRIAWRSDGPEDAPVLLLSNSLGTAMAMWDVQLPALTQRFRVLRYDTRGHGASDATPGDYGLDRLGRDAAALLDALAIDRAHVCGLSLGGMTAQWLGVFAPERVDRLVLANTSAHMGPAAAWQQRMARVRADGMAAIVDAVLSRWFTDGFMTHSPAKVAAVRQMLETTSPAGYAGCCAAIRDMDMRPLSHLIAAPCLIIGGTNDPATPPEHARALATAICDSRLLMLPAAHLSNIEQPEAFTSALIEFLG